MLPAIRSWWYLPASAVNALFSFCKADLTIAAQLAEFLPSFDFDSEDERLEGAICVLCDGRVGGEFKVALHTDEEFWLCLIRDGKP